MIKFTDSYHFSPSLVSSTRFYWLLLILSWFEAVTYYTQLISNMFIEWINYELFLKAPILDWAIYRDISSALWVPLFENHSNEEGLCSMNLALQATRPKVVYILW